MLGIPSFADGAWQSGFNLASVILRYIKAAGFPACDCSSMEEVDANVMAIARAMLRAFGSRASRVMRERIRDHERAGEREGAEFWVRVEQAIECLTSGAKTDRQ